MSVIAFKNTKTDNYGTDNEQTENYSARGLRDLTVG